MTPDSQRNGVELTLAVLDVTLVQRKRTRPRVRGILQRQEITGLDLQKDGVANDIIASQLSRQYNGHLHSTEIRRHLHRMSVTLQCPLNMYTNRLQSLRNFWQIGVCKQQ
jgi:hypothetical protein